MATERSIRSITNKLQAEPEAEPMEVAVAAEQMSATTTETEDGGVVVDFEPTRRKDNQKGTEHDANLAEVMEESARQKLASDLVAQFEADRQSRMDWERTYMKGLDLLGLKFEDRSIPWEGACGVFHPLLAESVVRFQAQTIQEIFPASGPARTAVVGEKTQEKTRQADRVQSYLNYLLTEQMSEYRGETERLLFSLPLAGSAFRKVFYDDNLGRPRSMFVPAEDFIVSYGASDLATCERATHVMKKPANDVRKLQVSGFYRDVELPEPKPDMEEIQRKYNEMTGRTEKYEWDSRYTLLEMQVDLDLDEFPDTDEQGEPTGIARPYVVTIDHSSREVLAIRRNWREEDPLKLQQSHFVHYEYIPGLGFYGFGLVHLIGGLSKSATSVLRQLVDAGTLANLPGGLKSRGLRIKGDDTPIYPGEFRDVDVPGGSIKDNVTFLPHKEPSTVLYQLLGDLVNEGRRFASAADVKASDMNAEAPVGTTLAILEREMKTMSAIQARIHSAVRGELKILARLVADYGPTEYPYATEGEAAVAEDFDQQVDIVPVSDPNAGTMAQRIMQYQAALQLAGQAPQLYNLPVLHREMLEVLGLRDAEEIVPVEGDMKPTDPVSENMALMKGEPVRAFAYQDHDAHLQVHQQALENPKLQEILGQAPDAEAKMASLHAHIAEHVAWQYRREIEKELGVELPPANEPVPEDVEERLSKLVAPAAAQVTGKDKQEMAAREAQEKAEDPMIQMQKRELELKEMEIQAKAKADMAKIQADSEKALAKARLDAEQMQQDKQLETAKLGAQIAKDNADDQLESRKIASEEQVKGAELGAEIAKNLMDAEKGGDDGGTGE